MISQKIIEQLIEKPENTWLEFKTYWYWSTEEHDKIKVGWEEFLKDFSALLNTNVDEERYFLIGYDEKTGSCYDYFLDRQGKHIDILMDLEKFKKIS